MSVAIWFAFTRNDRRGIGLSTPTKPPQSQSAFSRANAGSNPNDDDSRILIELKLIFEGVILRVISNANLINLSFAFHNA